MLVRKTCYQSTATLGLSWNIAKFVSRRSSGILWISILEIALAFLSLTLEISVEHPMIKLTKKSLRTYVVAYESSIAIPEEIKFMCSSVRE